MLGITLETWHSEEVVDLVVHMRTHGEKIDGHYIIYVPQVYLLIPSWLLKRHDGIAEAAVRVASPHGPEGLQECDAIPSLTDSECPQGGVLDQRPRDIPTRSIVSVPWRSYRETEVPYQVLLTSLLTS